MKYLYIHDHFHFALLSFLLFLIIPDNMVIEMNNRINSRSLPLCIKQLAKEGYIIDIEYSNKLVRVTCEGNALRNLIPFGQTRLNEFGG